MFIIYYLFIMYCLFIVVIPAPLQVDDDTKRGELAALFGLSPSERDEVRSTAGATLDKMKKQQEEEEELFF